MASPAVTGLQLPTTGSFNWFVQLEAPVMKRQGIRAKTMRRFVRTTDSNHRMPVAENVLDREFTATKPNEK